jgi:hypothetical protein
MIPSPSEVGVEEIVINLVLWLKLVIEAIGAAVIGTGMILAGWRFTRGGVSAGDKRLHRRAPDAGAVPGHRAGI